MPTGQSVFFCALFIFSFFFFFWPALSNSSCLVAHSQVECGEKEGKREREREVCDQPSLECGEKERERERERERSLSSLVFLPSDAELNQSQ